VVADLETARHTVPMAEVWAAFEHAAEQAKRDLGAG
jgi:hypothetical protein